LLQYHQHGGSRLVQTDSLLYEKDTNPIGETHQIDIMDAKCRLSGDRMKDQGTYQNRLAEAFGMPDAPTLITKRLHKSTLAVTELKCERPNFGKTAPIPRDDAHLVALQFLPCLNHDLYFDGRLIKPTNWFPGVISIYDLRRDPVADMRDPFHSLMFYLPRKALDAMAYEAGAKRVGDLRHQPGVGIDDPVVRHLLASLLPFMAKPAEAHPLFLDHIGLALSLHMASVYGGMSVSVPRGGLAPAHERRVKDLMSASLKEDVPLSRLAAECGLSVRHFARAFRQSSGMPPHRWLLKHRVDRAKELLKNHALSLADVALSCGFADQSHFTRVFSNLTGCAPGKWRRREFSG